MPQPSIFGFLRDRESQKGVGQGLLDAANRGMVAGALGAPVDMATQAANLGVAGAGYLGHKLGLLSTPFDLIDSKTVPGSSEWIGQKMQNSGMVTESRNPVAEAGMGLLSPVAFKAAQKVGGLLYQAEQNAAMPSTLANAKQRGIFAGEWAQTADKAKLKAAQAMETKQADPRDIWNQTGWFKGPDGKWRFEIDDSSAGMRLLQPKFADGLRGQVLGEVLDHKGVFKAYPDSKKISVSFSDVADGGSYSQPRSWAEYIDVPRGTGRGALAHPDTSRSVMLHELQHAIQGREGFARGGNTAAIPDILKDGASTFQRQANRAFSEATSTDPMNPGDIVNQGAWDRGMALEDQAMVYRKWLNQVNEAPDLYTGQAYRALAGEAEARAVQARRNFTPEQRKSVFPLDSYDVPLSDLLVRY